MKLFRFLKPALVASLSLFSLGHAEGEASSSTHRISDSYDPDRDAFADLEEAKTLAAADGRRILLVVGGKWCPWCRALEAFVEKSEPVAELLGKHFVIMPVNVSDETSNTAFLNPYPAIEAYPHLFILDETGELLHSQDTGNLEKGAKGYKEQDFVEMLQPFVNS